MSDMSNAPSPTEVEQANRASRASEEPMSDNFHLLADVPVRLSVEVGSVSKPLAEILAFQEGEVIELDRQCDEPVDIKVNGTLVAKGEVIKVDGRFGVRITELANNEMSFPRVERRGA